MPRVYDAADYLEHFDRKLSDRRIRAETSGRNKLWGAEEGDPRLPIMERVQLLRYLAEHHAGRAGHEQKLASALQVAARVRHIDLSRRGGDDGAWEADTYHRFICDTGASPEYEPANALVDCLADIIEPLLVKVQAQEKSWLKAIIDVPYEDACDCFSRIIEIVGVPQDLQWQPRRGMISKISDALGMDPAAIDPDEIDQAPLREKAELIAQYLSVDFDTPSVAILRAPPATGRKMVVRYFVRELVREEKYFDFGKGRLPVLACALDEMSADEFVDAAFEFYAQSGVFDGGQPVHIDTKIDFVRAAAKKEPACVLISDLPPANVGGIIRGATQDYIGDVVSALLGGHYRTRIFVTTTPGNEALTAEIGFHRLKHRDFGIDEKVATKELPGGTSAGNQELRVPRLNARLIAAARAMIQEKSEDLKDDLFLGCRLLQEKDPEEMIAFIWDNLLDPAQQTLLGLCSCNPHGLKIVDLSRMLRAYQHLEPRHQHDISPDTDSVLEALRSFKRLVQIREPAARQPYAILDDGWRRSFLKVFTRKAPKSASMAHWLSARLAADDGRKYKMSSNRTAHATLEIRSSIQTLVGLIASVASVGPGGMQPVSEPSTGLLESKVLPPLAELTAKRPAPELTLSYAFAQVLRRDAQEKNAAFVSLADRADSHLEVLLAFFAPDETWRWWHELRLSKDPATFAHLRAVLSDSEIGVLLSDVADAAYRTSRFEIVTSATRIAEQVESNPMPVGRPLPRSMLLRIQRAELDASLLLGGVPSVFEKGAKVDVRASQIEGAITRLQSLASDPQTARNDPNDPMFLRNAGKVSVRLGEAHQLAGDQVNAVAALGVAEAFEARVVADAPLGQEIFPVLSARGAALKIRLMLAPHRAVRWGQDAKCVTLENGVQLPVPVSLGAESAELSHAKSIHLSNIRRLNARDGTQRLSMHIDESFLAAAAGDIGRALEILEVSGRGWHDVSLDVALELLASQAQLVNDAALLIQAWENEIDVGLEHHVRSTIAAYAEHRKRRGQDETSAGALLDLSEVLISALRRAVVRSCSDHKWSLSPNIIRVHVLEAWRLLLCAGCRVGDAGTMIGHARDELKLADELMRQTRCFGLKPELNRLLLCVPSTT